MFTPALPSDAKTLKLAAVIAMVLFVVLSVLALLLRHFQPEGERRERNSESLKTGRRYLPPDFHRHLEEALKLK